jgi:hypothetical protein
MAFKKRRMMFIPDVNPTSFVFFFERGTSGTSWSIRDYSIKNRVKELAPHHFHWTADEVHARAVHSIDAPTIATDNLEFWHDFTQKCNAQYLKSEAIPPPAGSHQTAQLELRSVLVSSSIPVVEHPLQSVPAQRNGSFPVLDLDQLLNSHKGRKTQDMERILHCPNSEDWVTWNFFRILLMQYPNGWWGHLVSAARRRNLEFSFPFDDRSLPRPTLWSAVPSPPAYEAASRVRMRESANREWLLRAQNPDPVEGSSEIDLTFDHDHFLVYIEAKLGSDISRDTKYDPQRNQIARNIDCLIESAGDRTPIFWLMVRDEAPDRAYVQLMRAYNADPTLLVRDLPHRDPLKLNDVARNLTILLWSDFSELVCGPGCDEMSTAVKRELARRILTTMAQSA